LLKSAFFKEESSLRSRPLALLTTDLSHEGRPHFRDRRSPLFLCALQFSEVSQMTHKSFLIAALLSAVVACSGGGYGTTGPGNPPPPPPPPPRTVVATNSLVFSPSTLHVNAGDQVTFSFGSVAHNVFFDAGNGAPTNIDGINANTTVQRTFPTAGTYTYNCHIHPGMSGTVVVN
jgi:plastocyanin